MKNRILCFCLIAAVFAMACPQSAKAQFRSEAFQQSYANPADSTARADTSDQVFSFKELFGGLAHKNEIKIGTMFAGSIFLPGASQIYNRQYWKLPVIYGGIGALAGTGGYYLHQYNKSVKLHDAWTGDGMEPTVDTRAKNLGTGLMIGAGVVYWASLLDGAACYQRDKYPLPGKATIYSILLPGLGQAYNGEYWKIPVYYSGLITAGYMYYNNNINYKRFKRIHNEATNPSVAYTGSISGETAKYYRDYYRRYRDYSVVGFVLVYLLQAIDANVFAYMHDFDVSDDLSINLSPAVIPQNNAYAFTPGGSNAFGVSLGLRF